MSQVACGRCWLAFVTALAGPVLCVAQEPDEVPVRDVKSPQVTGEPVTIQREPLRLIDPAPYQTPLALVPVRQLQLSALRIGTVRAVRTKAGEQLAAQTVAVELDTTELDLRVSRAEADLKVAELELQQAKLSNQPSAVGLADARLAAARAGRDLAKHQREQALIRAPFAANVFDVHVTPGQVVRPGDPLVTLGDTAQLTAEVPIDRNQTAADKPLELQIGDESVMATVNTVRPLADRFQELRRLIPAAASATVILDNAGGRFERGQTVFAPLVPRAPIAEIPNASVSNVDGGTRKVQVVRDDEVRDVAVTVLGPIGPERSYVSGPFRDGDELILSVSKPLADGTRIRSVASAADTDESAGPRRGANAGSTAARVRSLLSGRRK